MNYRMLAYAGLSACSFGVACAQNANQDAKQWPYEYLRGEYQVPCPDDETVNCIWHRLVIDNRSANTLECRGSMTYDSVNREQAASSERRMVILPQSRISVLGDTTVAEVKVTAHTLDCIVRAPLDSSKLTLNCKPTLTYRPSGADYPAASRRANEEGPVLVDFSLSDQSGPATDVAVAGSSLWPRLDEAGMKYVAQFIGVTDCKHGRFRVPVSFRLQ